MSAPLKIDAADMLEDDILLVQLSDGTTLEITLEQILSLHGKRIPAETANPDTDAPFNGN